MDFGPYAGFILSAYAAAGIIIVLLVFWVLLDHRAQKRALDLLEQQGITRRSAGKDAT